MQRIEGSEQIGNVSINNGKIDFCNSNIQLTLAHSQGKYMFIHKDTFFDIDIALMPAKKVMVLCVHLCVCVCVCAKGTLS